MSKTSLNQDITIRDFVDVVNENPTAADHMLYHAQEWMGCSLVYSDEVVKYFMKDGVLTADISEDISNAKRSSLKRSPFDYDDFAQLLELRDFLNYVAKTHNHGNSGLELIQHETNATVIVLQHCVVRFYTPYLYTKLSTLFYVSNKNIERVLFKGVKRNYGFTVTQKYVTVDSMIKKGIVRKSMGGLAHDHMMKGLECMHSVGFVHGDPTLNNTGYDPVTKQFVLFDFDRSRRIEKDGDANEDYGKMNRSFRYKLPCVFS